MERREREERAAAFERRVRRGDYGELFDPGVREILAQAAEERGLRMELGALRLTLAKLLAEERDAAPLALGVSRVASAASRVERVIQAVERERHPFEEELNEVLARLDAEEEAKRRALEEPEWVEAQRLTGADEGAIGAWSAAERDPRVLGGGERSGLNEGGDVV